MDLARRVCHALDIADRAVRSATVERDGSAALGFLAEKVVAETAMLLLCAASVQSLDERIRCRVDSIARLLLAPARSDEVLAAICLDPGQARDHAFAHAVLSALGLPDPGVDHVLAESLATGDLVGPERLPHRRLEQEWLSRVWNAGLALPACDPGLPTASMLGRPLDALASARDDMYAFTHAVMYLSDLGGRTFELPRSAASITADAEAALAYGLEHDDFDLVAELLLTWPMLGIPWSPAATVAFTVLTEVEDDLGFLPGSAFDRTRYESLPGTERAAYALTTSYHTGYVMGFVCAAILRRGAAQPISVPHALCPPCPPCPTGAGKAILERLAADRSSARWRQILATLDSEQLDQIAPLLLAAALRQAAVTGDLQLVKELLHLALACDLVDGPAPRQGAALLRRGAALGAVKRSISDHSR